MNCLIFEYPISNKTGSPYPIPIEEIFNRIRTGSDQARRARQEFEKSGKGKEYTRLKNTIPSFHPNLCKGGRSKESVEELSGLIYIDLDNTKEEKELLTTANWLEIKENLELDDTVYSCWFSVSGAGLGALVRVSGLNQENWLTNWYHVSNYFQQLTHREVDSKTKNINRAVFISYDKDIYVNENSRILEAIPTGSEQTISRPVKKGRLSAIEGGDENSAPFFTPIFNIELDPATFFSESFIDLHFAKELEKVKIDGVTCTYDGRGHYWFHDSFPYVRLMGRNKPIQVGARHTELMKSLCTLCFLNPHWLPDKLRQWLYTYNSDWCNKPLKSSELDRIFSYVYYDCYINNTLVPNIQYKKNHFTYNARFHKEEKQSKIGSANANVSLAEIIKAVEICMRTGRYISINSIVELTGYSHPTVIKALRKLDKEYANKYVTKLLEEAKHYEGVILEILPNFRGIILPKKPEAE